MNCTSMYVSLFFCLLCLKSIYQINVTTAKKNYSVLMYNEEQPEFEKLIKSILLEKVKSNSSNPTENSIENGIKDRKMVKSIP